MDLTWAPASRWSELDGMGSGQGARGKALTARGSRVRLAARVAHCATAGRRPWAWAAASASAQCRHPGIRATGVSTRCLGEACGDVVAFHVKQGRCSTSLVEGDTGIVHTGPCGTADGAPSHWRSVALFHVKRGGGGRAARRHGQHRRPVQSPARRAVPPRATGRLRDLLFGP
jgi:hypothetical protein